LADCEIRRLLRDWQIVRLVNAAATLLSAIFNLRLSQLIFQSAI